MEMQYEKNSSNRYIFYDANQLLYRLSLHATQWWLLRIKLSNDTYLVTFRGNGYTSEDKVMAYTLRRCAELTKEKGYNYFDILKSSSSTSQYAYTTPVQAHTESTYTGYSSGYYGQVNGSSTTTYTGGNTIYFPAYSKSITIKMYKTMALGVVDANTILSGT